MFGISKPGLYISMCVIEFPANRAIYDGWRENVIPAGVCIAKATHAEIKPSFVLLDFA